MHDLSFVKGITGSSLPSHLSDERITTFPLINGCKFAGRRVDGSAAHRIPRITCVYTRRKRFEKHQIEFMCVHIEHGENGKEQKEEKAKDVPSEDIPKIRGVKFSYRKDEVWYRGVDTVRKDTKARKEYLKQGRQDKEGNSIRKIRSPEHNQCGERSRP